MSLAPLDYEAGQVDATLGQPCRMCMSGPYLDGFLAAGGKLPFDATKDGEQTVYVVSEEQDPLKRKWWTIIGIFGEDGAAKTFAATRERKIKTTPLKLTIRNGVAEQP